MKHIENLAFLLLGFFVSSCAGRPGTGDADALRLVPLTRDVLSPESASAMDAAMQAGGYALIKYHLKAAAR